MRYVCFYFPFFITLSCSARLSFQDLDVGLLQMNDAD